MFSRVAARPALARLAARPPVRVMASSSSPDKPKLGKDTPDSVWKDVLSAEEVSERRGETGWPSCVCV